MNERIRELAEQAEEQVRVTTKSDMGYMGFEIDEDAFRKKFAELIVRECANVVNDNDFHGSSVGDRMLFEHFGVEE